MARRVEGDVYYELDGQLTEIKRQLRQSSGYPFDPELLRTHLQAGIEGRFIDLLPFPGENVEFELTLDGDNTDPLVMVRNDGYDPTNWKFRGPRVVGTQTWKFKLVRAGSQPNLTAVRTKLGLLAEGQWREAFRRKFYPAPGVHIGFGGSVWTIPPRSNYFLHLFASGAVWRSHIRRTTDDLEEFWLWLVPVQSK